MKARDRFVADDRHALTADSELHQRLAGLGEKTGLDEDGVGAFAEIDMDRGHGVSMKQRLHMSRPSRTCPLDVFRAWQCTNAGGSSRGMAKVIQEMEGLHVMVDDIIYMPSLDAPVDKPHPFVYFISIHNESPVPVTIRGRKWVVRDSEGETTVVEGEGVVGQTPTIAPGEHFSYNSYHVVAGGGAEVSGAFFGETAVGDWIFARIPDCRLELPK